MKLWQMCMVGTSWWMASAGIARAELLSDLTPAQRELLRISCEKWTSQASYASGENVNLDRLQDPTTHAKAKKHAFKKGLKSTLAHVKDHYRQLDQEEEFSDHSRETYHETVLLAGEDSVSILKIVAETTESSTVRGFQDTSSHIWVYPQLEDKLGSTEFFYCTGKSTHALASTQHLQVQRSLSCTSFTSFEAYEVQKESPASKVATSATVFTHLQDDANNLKQLNDHHWEALQAHYKDTSDSFTFSPLAALKANLTDLAWQRHKKFPWKRKADHTRKYWVDYAWIENHLVKSHIISEQSEIRKEGEKATITKQWIFPLVHNEENKYLFFQSKTTHGKKEEPSKKALTCSLFQQHEKGGGFPNESEALEAGSAE